MKCNDSLLYPRHSPSNAQTGKMYKQIRRQDQNTWTGLNTRMSVDNQLDFVRILDPDVRCYLELKAKTKKTNLGYMFASILTTTNYLLAKVNSKVITSADVIGEGINPNIMTILVGEPSSGKSQAINTAVIEPLEHINFQPPSCATSSALLKVIPYL